MSAETDCVVDIIGLMILPFICDWLWTQIKIIGGYYESICNDD